MNTSSLDGIKYYIYYHQILSSNTIYIYNINRFSKNQKGVVLKKSDKYIYKIYFCMNNILLLSIFIPDNSILFILGSILNLMKNVKFIKVSVWLLLLTYCVKKLILTLINKIFNSFTCYQHRMQRQWQIPLV